MSQAEAPDQDVGRSAAAVAREVAEENPLAHPAIASTRLFEYSHAPGPHLTEFYNTLWKAVDEDFPHAPTRVARLMPRGHGKTEGAGVVFPTWLILDNPGVRVAIISKTKGLASERTEKAVQYIERFAPLFGVEIAKSSEQELTTESNDHKEATISPYGLESQLTGKHFDVIIYDDIADWENQRTSTQRRNVRNYFGDYVDNLPSNDSALPNGSVQAVIGTRKHPEDVYETDILDDPRWDVGVYTAINEADWGVVEARDWQVRGDDGTLYDDIADLPADVALANNGVLPNRDVNVLWPELQPPEALLYDIVGGSNSTAIWRRENQQDPQALAGEVFKSEWLVYVDELPKPRTAYEWYGGLDVGLVDDPQAAVEGDSDYSALTILAWDAGEGLGYVYRTVRDRGMSVKETADWAVRNIPEEVTLDKLLVEQNANRGVAQRLRDDSDVNAEGVSSSGDKEARLHDLASDFQAGDLRLVGSPEDAVWASFEQQEWLQFPTAAHDDRLDSMEIARRNVSHDSGDSFLITQ
ncbi:terminase family protein (plasmid) [Halobacterium salinarum]|uniref:terminase large subunit domain-containing protein n=1 Tax=Halobacterium salinarum TaxID=2242 RepID=UPI0030D432D4